MIRGMDILSQYNQQRPEASQEQKQTPMTDQYGRTYGGMTAWVIRVSGGRIRDARGASYVLFGVAVIVLMIAIFVYSFWGIGEVKPIQSITTDDVLPR